jgi:hypothetical protein
VLTIAKCLRITKPFDALASKKSPYPTALGRHVDCGLRQSTPSSAYSDEAGH